MKTYKCRECGADFIRGRPLQVVCNSIRCAMAHVDTKKRKHIEQQARQERKAIREQKEKLKTRAQWIKEAQTAFNAVIRYRDKDKPCICCGMPLEAGAIGGGYDCGHYRSTGSAPHLRFDEDNAHGQRKHCNRYRAGNAVDYRLGLIDRIGLERVEALEADHTPRKWTIPELKQIRDCYRKKLKEMKGTE